MKRRRMRIVLLITGILLIGAALVSAGSKIEKEIWKRKSGNKVERFTENTTIGEILKDPRFNEFSDLLGFSDNRHDRKKTMKEMYEENPSC